MFEEVNYCIIEERMKQCKTKLLKKNKREYTMKLTNQRRENLWNKNYVHTCFGDESVIENKFDWLLK